MARELRLTTPPMKGSDVKAHQRALNARLAAVKLDKVKLDSEYGPSTAINTQRVKYVLGFPLKSVHYDGASPTAQKYIAKPKSRPPSYVARKTWRMRHDWGWVKKLRKRQAQAKKGPKGAIKLARSHEGETEHPPNSNWGGIAETVLRYSGLGPAPWCGAFVRWAAEQGGGAHLSSRCVYVPNIVADAQAGRNGFVGWFSKPQPGDFAVINGEYHVGMVVSGYTTIEGNTTPGNSGNQYNGGAVAFRERGAGAWMGFARPRY